MSPGDRVVPEDGEIALRRTDVIIAHDALPELGAVSKPTLVLRGDHDACMPRPLSEDIADAVPAQLIVPRDGGT